jgi:HEAT repeat protein
MRIGSAGGLIFTGAALAPLVGNHSSTSTAIFLLFDKSGGNDRLTRVHVGAFRFPVYFAGAPAIWIDSATDAESVEKLQGLFARERSLEMKKDLISAVGVHRDASVVLQPLMRWIESSQPESIRREAVEAIGEISDVRAVAALARVARNDRNSSVAKEAVEAFGGMRVDAATDTLISFVTSLESYDLRRVAVESLGDSEDPRALAFLTKVALQHSDMGLRKEAVEALGSMHDEKAFEAISTIARRAPDVEVRRTAVEELGNSEPTDRAVDLLGQIIRNDPAQSVRVEAVEALGEVKTRSALDAVRAVAQTSGPEHLRRQAMETYSENADSETAVAFLKSIIASDPSGSIRLNALEILSELNHDVGIPAVRELARSSTDPRVRRQALEILSER